ncbi:MAG: hypothetical protein ACFFB3_04225 [Candidatus Hodarchaeota archaeon]
MKKDRQKTQRTIFGQIGDFSFEAKIAGFSQDVFPIDSFQQLVIELPNKATKSNNNNVFHRIEARMGEEILIEGKMVIGLPIYIRSRCCSGLNRRGDFKAKLTLRGLKIPILGISERTEGFNCENHIMQRVTSLLAWNDEQVRLLNFDWIKGSSDENIIPEGVVKISEEMNIEHALDVFGRNAEEICQLENCQIFLFLAPLALGMEIRRFKTRASCSNRVWQREWGYSDSQKALRDLQDTLNIIRFK